MTTRQARESLKENWNLNSIIGLLTIVGMVVTGILFIAPLRFLPDAVENISKEQSSIRQSQAVQTEALKVLADVAGDTKTMRRDVDINGARINEVQRRLDRLERAP